MSIRSWLPPVYEAEVLKVLRHPLNRHLVPVLARMVKPVIRKLPGAVGSWVCHYRRHRANYGIGSTPADAYSDWKRRQ